MLLSYVASKAAESCEDWTIDSVVPPSDYRVILITGCSELKLCWLLCTAVKSAVYFLALSGGF